MICNKSTSLILESYSFRHVAMIKTTFNQHTKMRGKNGILFSPLDKQHVTGKFEQGKVLNLEEVL